MSKLNFVFFVTHDPPGYVTAHSHNCYELVLYANGTGQMIIDDVKHEYSPGSFTVTCPGSVHDESHFQPTEVLVIGFDSDEGSPLLRNGLFFDTEEKTIRNLLEQIKKELLNKQNYYAQMLDLLVRQIVIELGRIIGGPKEEFDDFLYIKRYIRENLSHKITIADLARLSGYSYHRFRHLFKERCGEAPIEFLLQARMEKAESLLSGASDKLSAISEECGFCNVQQFIFLFKKAHGVTPAKFRKNSTGSLV